MRLNFTDRNKENQAFNNLIDFFNVGIADEYERNYEKAGNDSQKVDEEYFYI